jgi:Na+-transporting NADH:ubiquinone oxidoreductase subunit NqrD
VTANTRTRLAHAKARKTGIAAFALALAPRTALACPVCFGNSDAPMAIATNTGVLFMLGIVAVVLVAFASFFVSLIRRANRVSAAAVAADAAGLAPSEGTAQC